MSLHTMTYTFNLKPDGCVRSRFSTDHLRNTAQERNLNLQWQPTHDDLVSMPICAGFLSSTITHKFRQLISRVSKHSKVLNPNIAVTITNAPYFQPQTLMYGD